MEISFFFFSFNKIHILQFDEFSVLLCYFMKFIWLNWYLSESHLLEFFFPLSEITYSTDPSLFYTVDMGKQKFFKVGLAL